MELTYGSVCSGIEAATVAWHPLGWKAEWFAEIEKFPSLVLAHHYPDVPNLGDMKQVKHYVDMGDVEAPDVLVGGTPCQAFSLAGLRNSLSDERGQLTLAYVHLADVIDRKRKEDGREPAIVTWENVPGVLNTKDNAFGCFIAALSGNDEELHPPTDKRGKRLKWPDAGCVVGPTRTVAWRVLDAQYIGLAQRRRRVFVVASARERFHPAQLLFEFDGVRRDTAPSRSEGEAITGTIGERASSRGGFSTNFECAGGLQPISVTPFDTTQISSPQNYSKPKPGDPCHPLAATAHAPTISVTGNIAHTLRAEGFDASDDGTGRGTPIVCMAHGQGGAEISVGRSPTLTCNHEAPIAFHWNAQPDQMNFNEYTAAAALTCSQQAAVAFTCKDYGADAGPISPTLRAMGHSGSHANAGGQVAVTYGNVGHFGTLRDTSASWRLRPLAG